MKKQASYLHFGSKANSFPCRYITYYTHKYKDYRGIGSIHKHV